MEAMPCLFQIFQGDDLRYTHRNLDFKRESGPDLAYNMQMISCSRVIQVWAL